jgi:hypothetical protein
MLNFRAESTDRDVIELLIEQINSEIVIRQNNVLELWSLFDFLMPGLLGTERQFTARYSRPILAARDPRAAPHHLQAGALACEALHRQVILTASCTLTLAPTPTPAAHPRRDLQQITYTFRMFSVSRLVRIYE